MTAVGRATLHIYGQVLAHTLRGLRAVTEASTHTSAWAGASPRRGGQAAGSAHLATFRASYPHPAHVGSRWPCGSLSSMDVRRSFLPKGHWKAGPRARVQY